MATELSCGMINVGRAEECTGSLTVEAVVQDKIVSP